MKLTFLLSKAVVASCFISTIAFTPFRIHSARVLSNKVISSGCIRVLCPPLDETPSIDRKGDDSINNPSFSKSSSSFSQKIIDLVAGGQVDAALHLLRNSSNEASESEVEEKAYVIVLQSLSEFEIENAPDIADELMNSMLARGLHPSNSVYNLVISIWSMSIRKEASKKCVQYLEDLWSQHEKSEEEKFVPMRSSYISTITSLARSLRKPGSENAEKAESLLEEMEEKMKKYPQLSPNTVAVNAVLNAWSKSRLWNGPATRCEQILDRMISLSKERPELRPDTTSFNTIIDTLAKSKESNREQRAELLLEKMQELSSSENGLNCRPDQMSFNAVINCWAQSGMKGAARRATAILKHMGMRYDAETSDVSPDAASYSTAINAWARSRETDAVERAEEILASCEESYRLGNRKAKPNTLTYNSIINCYSKSNVASAAEMAISMLESMREKCTTEGFEDCCPDVVTYTSVIDTLAKQKNAKAAEKAIVLLEDLESAYKISPEDQRLKPNVRTYTSTINAIGRSGNNPEKAEEILKRIEKMSLDGEKAVTPDVVCYNAVINAYGWSDYKGKATRCNSILQRMIQVSESGENFLARPDVITCNSVLNACAFEETSTDFEREAIMKIVVETLELFQKQVPKYGYPDHATYAQVLLSISRQMPPGDKRFDMAEATFWQCCRAGHVSVLVVSSLEQALSWPRFATLMGSALKSMEGEKTSYDLSLFPRSWTRHSPKKRDGDKSRASRKRDRGFQVSKRALTQAKGQVNSDES